MRAVSRVSVRVQKEDVRTSWHKMLDVPNFEQRSHRAYYYLAE